MPDHDVSTKKTLANGRSPTLAEAPAGWRELAQEATQELDGQKLVEIVKRICDTLDQEEKDRKPPQREAGALGGDEALQEG